nr:CcdC protein domain-containing protein [Kibdelosporangium phytohabitans]
MALLVVGCVVVLVLRVNGEPLNWRDLLGPPIVLTAIGVVGVVNFDGLTGTDIAWVIGGCVIGFGFGAARATTVRLYEKDGELWQKYTKWSLLLFVAGVVVSGGYGLLAVKLGMHPQARPYQLAIGISFAGEAAVLFPRGLASETPFAKDKERPWDRLLNDRLRR